VVYARVRYATQGHHLAPVIRLDGSSGARSYVNEDLIADFTLIGKRILSPEQHQLFRFAYILAADVRACAKRLRIDRKACFQRLQAIEAKLGAYFRDVRPYPIWPLKGYFNQYQPGGVRPCAGASGPDSGAPAPASALGCPPRGVRRIYR
jgi:hypothetical protein